MLKDILAGLLLATLGLTVVGILVTRGHLRATAEETFDHARRSVRCYHRFWAWSVSYGFSFLCSLVFTQPLAKLWAPDGVSVVGGLLWLGDALPGALLLYWVQLRLTRGASAAIRAQRRRLGYRGYQVPVKLDAPPVPVAFPTAASPAKKQLRHPDPEPLRDPELVRETARKHWDAINFALASGGDMEAAIRHQQRFLDAAQKELSAEAWTELLEAYSGESEVHARRMAAIGSRQAEEREVQRLRRKREKRLLLGFLVLMTAIYLDGRVAEFFGLIH